MTPLIVYCGIALAALIINGMIVMSTWSTPWLRMAAAILLFPGAMLFVYWLVRIAQELHQQFLQH